MFKNLKKSVLEGNEKVKFLSDFDLYGTYDELLDQLMDTSVLILDNFDYDHRDLNKRFVDLGIEAGVKKVYYLQYFADDSLISEERSKLEKYIKEYPGLDASFVSLPMSMERLYRHLVNQKTLPQSDFTLMSIEDMETILKKIILIEDNDKESYKVKGLSYEDVHNYHSVFESGQDLPMRQFKSELNDFKLTTWPEYIKSKKQA